MKRTFLSVVPAINGKADVDLRRPGAYKLLAVARLADGTVLEAETGVVVKPPAKLPGLALQLDAANYPRAVISPARFRRASPERGSC